VEIMASILRVSNIESPDSTTINIDDDIKMNADVLDASSNPWGIESGSNANGNYTKFPDGTMMQWGFSSQNASTFGKYITYPIPFLAGTIPSWTVTHTNHHGGVSHIVIGAVEGTLANGTPGTIGFTAGFLTTTWGSPGAAIGFCWQAMGRWK
jgi:hypothetical protein